jgi:hypothetical protein
MLQLPRTSSFGGLKWVLVHVCSKGGRARVRDFWATCRQPGLWSKGMLAGV